jgi:hypothetical protein
MVNHWGLVKICWASKETSFFDSMPLRLSAPSQEASVRACIDVLMIMMHDLEVIEEKQSFAWVSERVCDYVQMRHDLFPINIVHIRREAGDKGTTSTVECSF